MNPKGESRSHHDETYVLTCDLPNKLQVFKRMGLKIPAPNHTIFTNFWAGLKTRLESATQTKVEMYDMNELSDQIMSKARECMPKGVFENGFVVSTCLEIAAPSHGATLEANRIVDPNEGKVLGIGPRPGFPSLKDQIRSIIGTSAKRDIVLVEDGSWTGTTLCRITNLFQELGKPISTVIVGLAFEKAHAKITKSFEGNFIAINRLSGNTKDWLPDHDFCPFVPNNGRVVGLLFGEDPVPYYTQEGNFFSVPYLLRFAPSMAVWASITDDIEALKISTFCLDRTAELFRTLENMNDCKINFDRLSEAHLHIGIPHSIGSPMLTLSPDANIAGHLMTCAHELD